MREEFIEYEMILETHNEWGRIFICENVEDYFKIYQEIKQVSPLLVG
jgi:hypothetical protein